MCTGKLHVLAGSLLTAVFLLGPTPREAALGQSDGKGRVDRYGDPLPRGAVARLGTVRYRHGGSSVAFLPDGRTVISVIPDNGIVLWDARTGRLLRRIETGKLFLYGAAAFAPAVHRLAVSGSLPSNLKPGSRFVIRVFDTATGKELHTFDRPLANRAEALALAPDGKYLFSLGHLGKLRIEEVASGKELLPRQCPHEGGDTLALSPDGSIVAVMSAQNTDKLFLWKWQEAEAPRELKTPHYQRGRVLAFSRDGKRLADCSGWDATLRLWDVGSGRLLHKLPSPDPDPGPYDFVTFAPDGKTVAVSSSSYTRSVVHLWNPNSGKFLKQLDIGGGALAFSPNGTLLAAGSRVWDFATGKELSANDQAHRNTIECVVTGRSGVVVTASDDHTVRLWDAATGKQRHCFVHDSWVRAVALSPDGSRLASSSLDDTVCLWDTASGRKIYQLAGHGRVGGHRAVAFTPDGKTLLSWGDDLYLRKWDVRTGKAILEHALRPGGIRFPDEDSQPDRGDLYYLSLSEGSFSPDGKYLVLRVGQNCLVYDTATGKELHKLSSEGGRVMGVAISPGGQLLAGSSGKAATLWDLATGKRCNHFLLPEQWIKPIAFASNGRFLAEASLRRDAPIRLVELATGREVRKLDGFRGRVRSLAFLPDGKHLVSGMDDGTALLWDLTH